MKLERVGEYRLREPLGQGGMGVVYLAEHVHSRERYAVKTVRVASRSYIAGIRREIRALAQIEHPNIIRVVAHGVHEGIPWYAMPYLEGVSLCRLMSDHSWSSTRVPALRRSEVRAAQRTMVEGADPQTLPESLDMESPAQVGWALRRTSPEAVQAPPPKPRPAPVAQATSVELDDDELPEDEPPPAEVGWALRRTTPEARETDVEAQPSLEPAPEPAPEVAPLAHGLLPERRRQGLKDARVRDALDVITQLCDALAYLHGEGIVHRDLKPSNVLLREGRAVLVDFGLALRGGSERALITKAFALGGTAAYMSPEQIAGDWIDARSDLYALGCILYEALTGVPPFWAETPVAVLAMHRDSAPRPPTELADHIPDELEALTLSLLEKRPEDRPGHVADVAARLRDMIGVSPPDDIPVPRAFLYQSTLSGRADELATLRACFDACRDGRGALVALEGVGGVGKTRLAVELIRHVKAEGAEVLTGLCTPGVSQHQPFYPLEEPVQEIVDAFHGKNTLRELLDTDAALLAPFFPALQRFVLDDGREHTTSGPRACSALRRLLLQLGDRRPLLLVLDDAHAADSLTLAWLHHLAERAALARSHVMILVLWRQDESRDELRVLAEHPEVQHIRLGRLDQDAISQMTRSMLGLAEAPAELVRFLSRQTGGNPFFAAEYLRTAVATGLFFRDRLGRWQVLYESEDRATQTIYENLPLPVALRELVVRRMNNLSTRERATVDAASTLGRAFTPALLARVAGFPHPDDDDLRDILASLDNQRILETEDDTGDAHFTSETLRELVYAQISEVRRRALHRTAALALEDLRSGSGTEIAHHWERAGEATRAWSHYINAARRAREVGQLAESRTLYQRALRLMEGSPDAMRDALEHELRLLNPEP